MTRSMTYDAGALIAAERDNKRLWALHEAALEAAMLVTVPAGALAQAWRGGPQPRLSQLLKACEIEPFAEVSARAAGSLCARAGTADVIDASVVLGAGVRGDAVVTSDPVDVEVLTAALAVPLDIISV